MKKIRSIISSTFGSKKDEASSAQECSNSSEGDKKDCIEVEQPDSGTESSVAVPSSSTGNYREARVAIQRSDLSSATVGGNHTYNITQYHIHYHHQPGVLDSHREIATHQGDFGAIPTPMEIAEIGKGYVHLDGDIFICETPIRTGVEIYDGKQVHPHGGERNKKGSIREVTIKVVPASEMAETEINRLVELADHNSIINIIRSGICPGIVEMRYIAMEQYSKNLQEYVAGLDGRCDFSVASIYAKQLASGLAFIHKNNFIHGDLKPLNIVLSKKEDYVKISNFGYSQNSQEGKLGICKPGTHGYRAPELYGVNSFKVVESDVFSYGLVIFFLFTGGKHPFGADPEDCSYNIKKREPADLLEIRRIAAIENSSTLVPLIGQTLAPEASHRPKSEEIVKSSFFQGIDCECLQRQERPWMRRENSVELVSGEAMNLTFVNSTVTVVNTYNINIDRGYEYLQ